MFQAVGMAGYCLIAMNQTFSMYIRTHIEPQKNNFQKFVPEYTTDAGVKKGEKADFNL